MRALQTTGTKQPLSDNRFLIRMIRREHEKLQHVKQNNTQNIHRTTLKELLFEEPGTRQDVSPNHY